MLRDTRTRRPRRDASAPVLQAAEVPAIVFGARETTHNKLNNDLGLPDDPATQELYKFLSPYVTQVRSK
ncbi:MAG: hypothetical protein HYV60_10760 [Planctomycetia bacterium]|nr:hypothetical protein [Planctomycetia bacterium]